MMANSYSINHLTLKSKKKLLFHLLDLAILHSQLHSSFIMWELQNFTQKFLIHPCEKYVDHTGQEQSVPRPLWRPTSIAAQVSRLSGGAAKNGLLHIPCSKDSQECEAKISAKCRKCDMELHVIKRCSEEYHTKAKLQNFELNLPMQNSASY